SQPVQEARFGVVDAERARAVAGGLAGLEQELGPSVSPTSRAVLRAGLLAREGFLHDARSVVAAGIAADRDEPTLHQLLGDIYTRTGLTDLASESFDEANYLLSRKLAGLRDLSLVAPALEQGRERIGPDDAVDAAPVAPHQ